MTIAPSNWKQSTVYKQGKSGEKLLAQLFKERGWYVIPSYDYVSEDEKAPQMQGLLKGLIIPDLDICRDGERRWIEVKTYSEPSFYKKKQEWQHGIKKRHWDSYREVERISGTPVWIYIYQLSDGRVYAQLQHLLVPHVEVRLDYTKTPQYYFPISRMQIIHTFDGEQRAAS